MSKAYRCVQGGRGGKRLCVRTQFAFFYKGKLTKNHFITTLCFISDTLRIISKLNRLDSPFWNEFNYK